MNTILEIKNLARDIENRVLWQGLSFSLNVGDILALKGPSGSGKTVMLRTLAGLEPIQSGTILYNSKAQNSYEMPVYRSQIIYLQQRPSFAAKTALESLKKPFSFKAHEAKEYNPDLVLAYLKDLGRDAEFLDKEIAKLSGGEEQIIALIRVLQLNPQIILLDEATASLDEETSQKLERLISHWVKQDNRACVWVSHEQKQLQRVANAELSL